ncbi:hypothetical protein ACHAWF_017080 [Thalassiosira exigua]
MHCQAVVCRFVPLAPSMPAPSVASTLLVLALGTAAYASALVRPNSGSRIAVDCNFHKATRTSIVPLVRERKITMAAQAQDDDVPATDAPPLICILAGQSNMVGRGEPEKLSDELIEAVTGKGNQDRIFLMYEIDCLGKEGTPSDSGGQFLPLGRTAQYSNAGRRHSCGPEWGIAERLLQSDVFRGGSRKDIYFIKYAAGSTNLHRDWAPGGELFSGMVALAHKGVESIAAERLQNARGPEREGCSEGATIDPPHAKLKQERTRLLRDHTVFFWLQGESDASGNAVMRSSYKENFQRFVVQVRKALVLGEGTQCESSSHRTGTGLDLPFVASELDWPVNPNSKSSVRFAKRLREINLALGDACAEFSQGISATNSVPCAFANFPTSDNDGYFALSHHPDGHCDNEGLLSLGRNMAKCFCKSFLGDDGAPAQT